MSEIKSYHRREDESDAAHAGWIIYRDLGPSRTVTAAYEIYREKAGKSKKEQKRANENSKPQASGAFNGFVKDFEWEKRARDWDKDEEKRLRDILIAEDEQNYVKDLGEFRKLQVESGKLGVKLSLKIKSDLGVYFQLLKKQGNTHPIETLREAEQMARILNMIEGKSSEQWSKALLIDELLKELQEASELE